MTWSESFERGSRVRGGSRLHDYSRFVLNQIIDAGQKYI